MGKKHRTDYEKDLIAALKKLPFPIYDKRHNLTIFLDDERSRSNQRRFEHISRSYHKLTTKDLEVIPSEIVSRAKLKKDPSRKDTFNYYILRKAENSYFVKICIKIIDKKQRTAKIKTIFTTKSLK